MQSFSRVNYFGHYILFPPSPLFSLISVCWLISDVSGTSKRFLTTMKVKGQVGGVGWGVGGGGGRHLVANCSNVESLVLFEKDYVRDYESNEKNTTVTSSVKSNER